MRVDEACIYQPVREFTLTPGPRERTMGKFSGQEFLEDYLKKAFEMAVSCKKKLVIELDGTGGYSTAFFDGSIGALSREWVRSGKNPDDFENIIEIRSDDRPWYVELAQEYVQSGRRRK